MVEAGRTCKRVKLRQNTCRLKAKVVVKPVIYYDHRPVVPAMGAVGYYNRIAFGDFVAG